jgi:hypothetical protein
MPYNDFGHEVRENNLGDAVTEISDIIGKDANDKKYLNSLGIDTDKNRITRGKDIRDDTIDWNEERSRGRLIMDHPIRIDGTSYMIRSGTQIKSRYGTNGCIVIIRKIEDIYPLSENNTGSPEGDNGSSGAFDWRGGVRYTRRKRNKRVRNKRTTRRR